MDLADEQQIHLAIEQMRARLGRNGKLHALVNNAAISPKDETGGRLGSTTTDMALWRKVFQVNFFAPIMLANGLQQELERAKGAVVNVTSIAGTRVHPFAGRCGSSGKACCTAARTHPVYRLLE